MKFRAAILLLIWSLLLIQPGFSNLGGKPAYTFCKKNENSASNCVKKEKSSCQKKNDKPIDHEKKNESGKGKCNPTLGCSSGNFYTFINSEVSIDKIPVTIQKIVLLNDNRLATQLSECWHPPELSS